MIFYWILLAIILGAWLYAIHYFAARIWLYKASTELLDDPGLEWRFVTNSHDYTRGYLDGHEELVRAAMRRSRVHRVKVGDPPPGV
jgi:hypothetical protein